MDRDGEPPFDLWEVDIRRAQPFQRNRRYLKERVTETLGLLYADHWPYRQVETARGVRRSPVHEHLKGRGGLRRGCRLGAGQLVRRRPRSGAGIPLWLAPAELVREFRSAEHMAVREGVGLFDMTSFGKIRVEGRDAPPSCSVCANEMDVPSRADRLHPDAQREGRHRKRPDRDAAVGDGVPAGRSRRDAAARSRLAPRASRRRFVTITDMTAAEAVFCVMGPKARDLATGMSAPTI
jgi:hypothetical protein